MAFIYGFVGAALAEYLRMRHIRTEPRSELPPSLTETHYWVMTVIECAIGGGAALLYSGTASITPYIALNVGAAWPLLLICSGKATSARRPPDEEID